jgi:N-acetylglucosaminyl-diphospho-decaprenol L-rhamnosyltransferase
VTVDAGRESVAVSIVSHGHGKMVSALIDQLRNCPEVGQVIVTQNVPEEIRFAPDDLVSVVENSSPKGFGANHNAAFRACRKPSYCVLNPDIELVGNPFPSLSPPLADARGAIVAPLIVSPSGCVEDSARHFPTMSGLLKKAAGRDDGRYPMVSGQALVFPDWVAGMFMLFRATDYARLGGFDERYFLYYEDVDICARAWRAGMKVVLCPSVSAIHDARRQSRKSLRHLRWHLASMARYFLSGTGQRA